MAVAPASGKRPLTSGPGLALCLLIAVIFTPLLSVQAQRTKQVPAPTFRQLSPGLLARTTYSADPSGPYRIEIWDLLVGPGQKSAAAQLPGGALFEVRAGSGEIQLDGKPQPLRPGSTIAVPAGVSFTLVNRRDDLGLAIRAVVIARRAP